MKKNIYETPLWQILSKACDLLIIGILWAVCSLPLITMGAASAAAYHTVHRVIYRDEGTILAQFKKSFLLNLKQAVILELMALPILAFAGVAWYFADFVGKESLIGTFYRILSVVLLILIASVLQIAFPLLSRFYMETKVVAKTAGALAVVRVGFTLILDLICVLSIAAILTAPFMLVVMPGLYFLAAERLLEPGFIKASGIEEPPVGIVEDEIPDEEQA